MADTAITVAATPQSVKWGFFDAATPAITSVPSGTEVIIETVSGEPNCVPTDGAFEILPEHLPILKEAEHGPGPHLLTGPIHVEGAKPGDVLAVDILDVTLRQNWGFNLIIPLLGTIPEDFQDFTLKILPIDKEAKTVTLPWGGKLALHPFFGVMGVAPPSNWGRITSIIPRAMGGNLDNKDLVAGTKVYFPIFNEGALFTVGDGHAAQGHGEVCITGADRPLQTHRAQGYGAYGTPRGNTDALHDHGVRRRSRRCRQAGAPRHDPLDRRTARIVERGRLHALQPGG